VQHLFCSVGGVKPFFVPRSHSDGSSVNANCLEPETVRGRVMREFDGANWRKNSHQREPHGD